MGTKVQCKSYSPAYYSMRDLNEGANIGSWPIYYENKNLNNGQYYNCFLPKTISDGYSEYDKEVLKQTMLEHETIFRKQVYELHRLYRIQRDLMDELKRKELQKYSIPMEASRSSPLSSQTPSEVPQKMWQSPLNFLKQGSTQSCSVQTQNGGSLKQCELLESKSEKVSRKGFDLQLPADEHLDSEDENHIEDEKAIQVPMTASYPLERNCGVASQSGVKLSLGTKSDLCSWNKHGLADLNEPVQVEEATTSSRGPTAFHEDIQWKNPYAKPNSFFMGYHKEFFQNNHKGKDDGTRVNVLPLENERNKWEWLSYNLEDGQSRSNPNSSLPRHFEPLQVEPKKAHELPLFLLPDDTKREPWRERAICGTEISERCRSLSNNNYMGPVVPSHRPNSYPTIPQSDVISGSSLIPSWIKPPLSSNLSVQSAGLIGEERHLNRSSGLHSSCGSKVIYRNGFCHGSQSESNASQVRFSSIGFDSNSASEHFENHGPSKYFRGSNCVDVKSAKDTNLNLALMNGFRDGKIPHRDLVIVDGEEKNEDTSQGLPWLGEDSKQTGLDFLRGYSQQFTNKTGMEKICTSFVQDFTSVSCAQVAEPFQRIEVDDCPGNKKIFGAPIFDKTHISKDQSSFSPPSKSLTYSKDVEKIPKSGKVGLLDIDLSRDLDLPDSCQELSSKSPIVDHCGSMYHINLNSCTSDEETPSTLYVPRVTLNIASEIDLEAPVVPDTMESIPPGEDSLGNQLETGQNPPDELARVAADAIVIMSSSSSVHTHLEDPICVPLEASLKDSLNWFVEIVTSNTADHDEFSDGSDCFESMTLKLTETKVDENCCKIWVPENQKEEETGPSSLTTRGRRRGQGRRGRHRRDFQRDILPGLTSLSRQEVTEDLQAFGGLMRATGHPWPGLARRNAARNGRARGRRRSPAVLVSPVCSPPRQQPNNNEPDLEERSLKGWGKTTRRPRRHRFPSGTPSTLTQV